MPPRRHTSRLTRAVASWIALASLAILPGNLWAGDGDQDDAKTTKYNLTSGRTPGQVYRVVAKLEVGGDLKVKAEGKVQTVPMSVDAKIAYDEKLLRPGVHPLDPLGSVRHYHKADAVLKTGKSTMRPKLREERRLLVVNAQNAASSIFSPVGELTRQELDLVNVVGNSLVLDLLLPGRKVAVGERWKPSSDTIRLLLGLDAVADSEVECDLTSVKEGVAVVAMQGKVNGAAEGVSTELKLTSKFAFDLKQRYISGIALAVKEDRSIGHVGPGVDLVAKLRLQMRPIEPPAQLSDAILADVPTEPNDQLTRLIHESRLGGFRFACDRRWYVTGDQQGAVVLRMVDRGDLLAQCNISSASRKSAKNPLSLAQYQNDVRHALGKRFGRILTASEWTDELGQRVYRVVARGDVEKLPIEWRYYLIANKNSRRAAVAITVEPGLIERMGDADRELVATIGLFVPKPTKGEKAAAPTAAKAVPQVKR